MIPVMSRMWMPHGAGAAVTGTHLFYFDTEDDEETQVADIVDYFGNKSVNNAVDTAIGYEVDTASPFLGSGSLIANTASNFSRYFIFNSHEDWDSWKETFTWEGFAQINNGITDEYSNTQVWLMGHSTANFSSAPYLAAFFETVANGGSMKFAVTGITAYSAPTLTRPDDDEFFHWAISVDGDDLYFGLNGSVERYNGAFSWGAYAPSSESEGFVYIIGNRNNIAFTSTTAPQVQDNIRITHGVARYTDTTNGYTVPGSTYTD